MAFWLFAFGALVGSFLNVVALRYDPERFLFGIRSLGGRSRCPNCGVCLRWFELIPFLSFALQGGRCRSCRARVSFQYPFVELLSGLIFVFVPRHLAGVSPYAALAPGGFDFFAVAAFWILVFETLLLVSLIDFHLQLIPDEASIFLGVLGILFGIYGGAFLNGGTGSFAGEGALLLGFQGSVFVNRLFALFGMTLFFVLLVLGTRGRGMGMGDVKLMAALSLLFGWPDALFTAVFAFVIGALAGSALILAGRKTRKSAVPFGPFLALGAATLFFYGRAIFDSYLSLFAG